MAEFSEARDPPHGGLDRGDDRISDRRFQGLDRIGGAHRRSGNEDRADVVAVQSAAERHELGQMSAVEEIEPRALRLPVSGSHGPTRHP